MKKILPYILIFVILLQLFAPFSVGVNDKKIEINQNIKKAEAADCIVKGVTFVPPGGTTKENAPSLPSYIIAKINTQNCINQKIQFSIDETYNWLNQEIFNKEITISENETQLKLLPTELRCGSKDLCGFKYNIGYGAYNSQYGWSLNFKSIKSVDHFYKCVNEGCTNQSSWDSQIISGGNTDEKPEINYKIELVGNVTNTDKNATVNLIVNDKTNYSAFLAGSITYKYTLNIFLKNKDGAIIDGKSINYTKENKIDPIVFTIEPSTIYTIDGSIDVFETTIINGQSNGKNYSGIAKINPPLSFTSNESGDQTVNQTGSVNAVGENIIPQGDLPACSLLGVGDGDFMGCIAQGVYYLFFKTTSFVFGLTGKILDFTLMYSIDDNSYRSTFVVEGWGIIRDFCNMFFIFVLLYIAFGTILNLNGVKTKEMIVNVVIIGLLINFSLFTTRFIIDASNILTRVFYNQNTITTGTQKDSSGNIISELGEFGEIKLSEAIVSKVDPQRLIMEAQRVESIPIRGQANNENQNRTAEGITTGTFILVVLLATAVNIVGIVAFLSSALVFIGRVVMLWMAMILSPLAFFSYTVPFLQGIKMVGWKNWWSDTLSMAFVAPVFAFFMYIIVSFLSKGLGMIDASLKDGYVGLSFAVAMIVPFVFIMVLLMKAKSVAVSMSGEVGSMLSKAGGAVAGLALGAATGGAAMLGRATIGNMGNKLANSKWASTHGAVGRGFQNVGKWAGSSSFDARSTKLGQKAGSGLGVDLGKAKSGGFTKHLEEKTAKKVKRAEELKVHEEEPLKQALNKTEMDLQSLLSENKSELDGIDKAIEKARNSLKDAKDTGNTHDQTIYSTQLEAFKKQRDALIKGKDMRGMGIQYFEDNGAGGLNIKNIDADYEHGGLDSSGVVHKSTRISDGSGAMLSITDLEKKQRIGKEKIEEENRNRTTSYAKGLWTSMSSANREAEHKIIMGSKIESGQK